MIQSGLSTQKQAATVNDMWHTIGVDSELFATSPARVADREYAQSFAGGEIVGRGSHDSVLTWRGSRASSSMSCRSCS